VRLFERTNASFGLTSGLIGSNGSVLEVRGIEDGGLRLRSDQGREGLVKWSTLTDRDSGRIRLTYGDALTIDNAQGLTSDQAIFVMPRGSSGVTGFKAYVANSRARGSTWLVASEAAEKAEVERHRPIGDLRQVNAADMQDNMARNLSRQPEKESALSFMERAEKLHRETLVGFQNGLQAGEQRALGGLSPTTLHQQLAEQRQIGVIERLLQHLERPLALLEKLGQTIKLAIEGGRQEIEQKTPELALQRTRNLGPEL